MIGIIFTKFILYENTISYGISPLSSWIQLIVIFIILDFTYYIYHFLMHKFGIMWRFHSIHHSDTVLNVATSLREHPIETIIRMSHYIIVACLLGPLFWIISLHQLIQVASKIIIHSNFRFPDRIDKQLSIFLITPNMHHVHHHYKKPYTDSNFGDLFSIWDRLFCTFRYLPKEKVQFGLDDISYTHKLTFLQLLKTYLTTNIKKQVL
ncbi:MAG: sterol desaturase family protein [Saprospiraceae bacterium]|uniref:Sterol desaturase family protein n=1 Tax=Candidatus Defluviibacterium haderslevense TaxID=2981993 RepID=A0A9D7SCF8_9BACT|nr:sterol desaturase family protein [Candidatus Defluviibacterium haderslevense]